MLTQCLLLFDRGCILNYFHFYFINYWQSFQNIKSSIIISKLIKLYRLINISGCPTSKSVVENFSLLNKRDKNFECPLYQDQERFVPLKNLRKQRSGPELFSRFVSPQNLLTTFTFHSGNFPIPEINNLPNVRSYLMLMLMVQ